MFRPTRILDVTVNGELKPIEFYSRSVFEYELGWTSAYLTELETKGNFPKTPIKASRKNALKLRLYTKKMVEEVVDLVERSFPVIYRGTDLVKKAINERQFETYREKVSELETKWKNEVVTYLDIEPATPKPLYIKRKGSNAGTKR